jgi:hypothetical protein
VFLGGNEILNESSLRYLEQFYRERVVTHFVGAQVYWKGDDFIEELMLASPIVMYNDLEDGDEDDTDPLEIEPLRVAEQILLRRDKLAFEWFKIMEAVPSDHTEIRRMQLARAMGQNINVDQKADAVFIHDEFQ